MYDLPMSSEEMFLEALTEREELDAAHFVTDTFVPTLLITSDGSMEEKRRIADELRLTRKDLSDTEQRLKAYEREMGGN